MLKEEKIENFNFQRIIVIVGILLFLIKIIAWYLTDSVAILTDALESIVNIISGFVGLYSLYLSGKPRDSTHPYGHGKIEYISSSIEGSMITIAGIYIIITAIKNLITPNELSQLDLGIILILISGIMNYLLGTLAVRKGKKNISPALIASGKHLQTDTMSTIGIIVGLILITVTKQLWLDSIIALIVAGYIIFTGIKILKNSISGIMDEADFELVTKVLNILNNERRDNWIDIHGLAIIKYGSVLHLDCHLTVPWYLIVTEEHYEVEKLEDIVKENFKDVDINVHTDACDESFCNVCLINECDYRTTDLENKIEWTVESSSKSYNENSN